MKIDHDFSVRAIFLSGVVRLLLLLLFLGLQVLVAMFIFYNLIYVLIQIIISCSIIRS